MTRNKFYYGVALLVLGLSAAINNATDGHAWVTLLFGFLTGFIGARLLIEIKNNPNIWRW